MYRERSTRRIIGAAALVCCGIVLKIIPVFCLSLIARLTKKTMLFACIVAGFSLVYFFEILDYLRLIRRNVPTTFILSYGYKAPFLGIDHLRGWAGLSPLHLEQTWAPALTAAAVLVCAIALAFHTRRNGDFVINASPAGTAFLFGAGIYCGTYLLGTNFIYRLMFLLLCIPQLQDWQINRYKDDRSAANPEVGLFGLVIAALWLNGNANGHSVSAFLALPQMLNMILFFFLCYVLLLVSLRSLSASGS